MSALDAVKAEGNAGTTAFTFTVARAGDTGIVTTVDYDVTGSGATEANGADFSGGSLPSGTVNFAVGETSKTITVQVSGDTTFEPDEEFTLTLSNPTNGQITGATATGTIQNDDAPPTGEVTLLQADFNGISYTEGFSYSDGLFGGSTSQVYAHGSWNGSALEVNLGGRTSLDANDMSGGWQRSFDVPSAMNVSVSFTYEMVMAAGYEPDEFSDVLVSVDGGTPIQVARLVGDGDGGADMTTGQQTINVDLGALGAGTHTIAFGGFNNKKTEFNESTEITIDDVVITGTTSSGPTLSVSALDATKAEGNAGTTAFTFTVARTGDTSSATTVDFDVTGSGTDPASGTDFSGGALPSGTINFAGGETSQTITIQVSGDTAFEADEDFTVTLSNPTNGQITGATAIGTIQNDDAPVVEPTLSVSALDATKAEGNAGTTAFTFTVARTGDTSGATTVDFDVSGSGANPANGTDFSGGALPSGTVNFAAGETSQTFTVQVSGDTTFEQDEGFTVTLSNPTNGQITGATATGTIQNDDAPPTGVVTLLQADFNGFSYTEGFSYSDGLFGGSTSQIYARGSWNGSALEVNLGGRTSLDANDMSGGWQQIFDVPSAMHVSVSFTYEMVMAAGYEPDEFSDVLVSVDGGTPIQVARLFGDGDGGADMTTGEQTFNVDLGILGPGTHTIAFGGYNNKKTEFNESTEITIDNVHVTGVPAAASVAEAAPRSPDQTDGGVNPAAFFGRDAAEGLFVFKYRDDTPVENADLSSGILVEIDSFVLKDVGKSTVIAGELESDDGADILGVNKTDLWTDDFTLS